MVVTNKGDIPIGLAVWLLHDEYDYVNESNYISVTQLMKPLRHIILPRRVPAEDRVADLEDYTSRALGNSIHDSIEKAWIKGYERSLKLLGYPDSMIKRVCVNPTDEELATIENPIPVYLEQRSIREFGKYKLGGKYDMVAEGIVHDNKSTSAYTWLFGTRDEEHRLQGSLYRWLNPKRITEDFIRINFIFTDWQKAQAAQNPKYPQKRLLHKDIPLLSIQETEDWIQAKLNLVEKYIDSPEKDIPECTDEELWRSETQYKYYANPEKTTGRSTKNFSDPASAKKYMMEKGGKGVIVTVPGEVKRCNYCDAFPICTQKDKYFS
jgi:hypothetical protein